MKTLIILLTLTAVMSTAAWAEVRTEMVEYRQGDVVLEGFLAWNDSIEGKRPGVLVVHEWYGLNEYAKRRARMVAELGYVAFAADIYGKDMRADTAAEASKLSSKYRADRALMRARAKAALDVLRNNKLVDANRLVAIGYCFGGTVVLELARSGADLSGVVSFHGGLDTPDPGDARNIKGSVLVLHGSDDPNVGPKAVAAFQQEMREAGVDWQMVYYGGAVHSFTNPASGNDNSRGVAYNKKADLRSWKAMEDFLKEVFNK